MSVSIARRAPFAVLVALAAVLSACGGGSSSGSDFSLHTTTRAASPSAPILVTGDWMVYFASEAFSGPAGTVLNGDADTLDQVAYAVNLNSRVETNLGVAAQGGAILGSEVYLVVDEAADGVDWDGDTLQDKVVLLHWSQTAGVVAFVDVTVPNARLVVADTRLFYESRGAELLVADETTLRSVVASAPTTPVAVLAQIGGLFVRGSSLPGVRPLSQQAGLLFCAVDEDHNGLDYNQDGDSLDATVLLLLDATDPAGRLLNTELAMADDDEPVAARSLAAHDWLVAFLVDEASQGGTNLNDQANFSQPLLPENCLGTPDADASDKVLHYLDFSDFSATLAGPIDTGLAGHDRVLVLNGFVATLSAEEAANCNLNADTGDTDTNDDVLRWVATTLPVAPARSVEDLHAVATGTAGGSMGVAVLDNRLIAVIDEAADDSDFDTQTGEAVADHDLIAWLDPAAGNPTWHFSHQSSSRGIGTGVFDSNGKSEPFAGTSWMAADAVNGRLPLVYLEEVPGATNPDLGSLNTNLDCNLVVKDSDKVDGLPVWADFESGPTLDFDGMGYAVDTANAGIVIASNFAFFRVSESADNRDYNNDGQINDVVLFRNPLTTCGPIAMATSSLITGPVITTDGVRGAGFLSSESQAGIDFNNDGDTGDLVVRFFRF